MFKFVPEIKQHRYEMVNQIILCLENTRFTFSLDVEDDFMSINVLRIICHNQKLSTSQRTRNFFSLSFSNKNYANDAATTI